MGMSFMVAHRMKAEEGKRLYGWQGIGAIVGGSVRHRTESRYLMIPSYSTAFVPKIIHGFSHKRERFLVRQIIYVVALIGMAACSGDATDPGRSEDLQSLKALEGHYNAYEVVVKRRRVPAGPDESEPCGTFNGEETCSGFGDTIYVTVASGSFTLSNAVLQDEGAPTKIDGTLNVQGDFVATQYIDLDNECAGDFDCLTDQPGYSPDLTVEPKLHATIERSGGEHLYGLGVTGKNNGGIPFPELFDYWRSSDASSVAVYDSTDTGEHVIRIERVP